VPVIERDVTGNIIRATGSIRQVKQIKAAMEKAGRKGRITGGPTEGPIPISSRITFPLNDDIKRLCMKMSVGALRRAGVPYQLRSRAQDYLLRATIGEVCPVRLTTENYSDLETRRPLAGHLVYVRANPVERRVYSIVQLFTVLQFWCELDNDYEGESAAVMATHDPVTHQEKFASISPLEYPLPERYSAQPFAERAKPRLAQLRLELVKLYPDRAPDSLDPAE
jgi:hypothetical protein